MASFHGGRSVLTQIRRRINGAVEPVSVSNRQIVDKAPEPTHASCREAHRDKRAGAPRARAHSPCPGEAILRLACRQSELVEEIQLGR